MSPRVSANKREEYLKDRRNRILDAAIEVFGNKGLDAATVDDVAESAGISKGTIYLYFKSKNDIFDAILEERSTIPYMNEIMNSTEKSMESADFPLQSFLEDICNKFLGKLEKIYPLFRLVIADAHRFPVQAEHVYNNLILKGNQMVAEMLLAQSRAGNIRKLDSPLITARCFIGMLLIYILSQEILGGKKYTPIKRDEWVKETVRIFLDGIKITHG